METREFIHETWPLMTFEDRKDCWSELSSEARAALRETYGLELFAPVTTIS